MQLAEIARQILYGNRFEDKLCFDPAFVDDRPGRALEAAPSFPGRPEHLRRVGKAEFPRLDRLAQASTRGRVLHFFANHELLAMELMALMLLRFPDAPESFRAGVARTIQEEQSHLRLYVARMRELGVDFGDLPVSDYFWQAMRKMRSPIDYVVQMSLTLEQANLDFSRFYRRVVAESGDEATAAILERVYQEEIGHVKHGLAWFNRWRDPDESDWEAYLRLLPPPMTARRAKGQSFDREGRQAAGFSARFIQELEVHSSSKGRPPVIWHYNPFCDAEIVRAKPGYSPPAGAERMASDLETIPMFLARDTDVIWVREMPGTDWLRELSAAGVALPEFRREADGARENRWGGVEPWGWSPTSFARFRTHRELIGSQDGSNGGWSRALLELPEYARTGFAQLFSKAWSVEYLRRQGESVGTGQVCTDLETALEALRGHLSAGETALVKAPWGTSGTQNRRVLSAGELAEAAPLTGWIRNTLATQKSIIVEPWLDKLADLSLQLEVGPESVRPIGVRRFINGARLEYRGAFLDAKLSSLDAEQLRFLHAGPLKQWITFARSVGAELRRLGYQGPAGLDAMLWRDRGGELRFKPLVELNPRWTMGRVAIELERFVKPGTPAAWMFIPLREFTERGLPETATAAADELRRRHGDALMFTNEPARAQETLTILVRGEAALADRSLRWIV